MFGCPMFFHLEKAAVWGLGLVLAWPKALVLVNLGY